MSRGGWALREALYTALRGNAALKALVGDPARVYDDVPPNASFPFVTFGDAAARDWSAIETLGSEHTVTLHVWSRYEGHMETQQILEVLETALHDASLAPAGHRLVNLRFASSGIVRDPDGATTHGFIRFRAVTEQIS